MNTIRTIWKHSVIGIVMLTACIITSCTDDDDADSGQVELLSFGPTGVKPGEQIRFIGNHLDEVTDIELTGAKVTQASFISQTSEEIVIIVPTETEEGFVTIKTSQGDITSKTRLSFDVTVTIESVSSEVKPKSNLTIKGNFLNWIKAVTFEGGAVLTEFVSQTMTELVVKVPLEAKTGRILISTGGTTPTTIESEEDVIVALPSLSTFSPKIIANGAELTITGNDLDWVKGVLFKGHSSLVTIVRQTENEIVVIAPDDASKGTIKLVTYSLIEIESEETLKFVGDLPDLAPLAYAFYTDALQNGWQNWGWSSTIDFSNAEKIRDGDTSSKITYQADGALYFGNGNVSTANYTKLAFSVFGSPGTDGKKIDLKLNWAVTYEITLQEGKWVDLTIPLTDLGSPASITDLVFQSHGWDGIVYIDQVGLR